jgi:hypothetical protein
MKQVVPNLTDVLTSRYIGVLGRLRKFARYWGTTTVDGVEVFTARKYCYPDMDESTVKLTKLLGIYEEVKSKQSGIRSTWLYFSPSKADQGNVNWDTTILASNFNLAMTKDLGCSLVIGPRLQNGKQIPAGITSPVSNQPALIAEIEAKYQDLWDAGHTFFSSEDDPYLAILVLYILRSGTIPYTIQSVAETVSTTYLPKSSNLENTAGSEQVKAWRVYITIPDYTFTPTTDIVTLFATEVEQPDKPLALIQALERFGTSTLVATPSDGSDEGTPDVVYENLPIATDEFWHVKVTPGTGGVDVYEYFLKTSIMTTPALNNEQKLAYLTSALDTGFRKKKKKWYEVVIVFIIIIVAVWIAGPAGAAAGAAYGAAVGTVVMVAVTVTIAALYISLAALAASYMGAQNVAAALGQFLRTVAPLVQIAGVIALVTGIYAAIRRGVEQAVAAAAQQGAKTTLSSIASNLASTALETVTGLTKLSSMTMSHIVKMLSFTFDIYKDMETRDLQRELKNYRTEIAALSESKEKSETSDIVKDLMASYPNPLAADWSYYAEIYDRPYEWWSTPYHTGNIQATTVSALWLNEPQNAILYNNSTGD